MKKIAMVGAVIAALAGTAGAHVLDEAKYFWRFDRDVNGDGSLQTTEIRDVRHWGSTNVNGYAGTLVPTTIHGNGLTNGPYWVTDTAPQPARGLCAPSRRNIPSCDWPFPNRSRTSISCGGFCASRRRQAMREGRRCA